MIPKIIECVPNFSEGRDMAIIQQITDEIEKVEGAKLLDIDPGKATNRTVVTFVGSPEVVIEAALQAIKKAAELIDMRQHKGEHPRMGATDVCPFIPISGVTMQECAEYARQLAQRVGQELGISVFLYEYSATRPIYKNLATIRAGEYEGMAAKLQTAEFTPDYGPQQLNETAGVTAIGARDFLVAYNANLNTTSVRRANSVAFDVRENGRILRKGNPITGEIITDENGEPMRQDGMCKSVKAIGWFIEEYGVAQVSMNLTNIEITPLHKAFEACCISATQRGMRVTGSEIVGMLPLKVLTDAGKYFLEKQELSAGVSEAELIKIAVKTMGLDELAPFDPQKKIIEYQLRNAQSAPLVNMTLQTFADTTASESPAPGGGSVAAYLGALGAALATMVANLSASKRGWDERWAEFSAQAERGQQLKDALLRLVDEDTAAFNQVMAAFALPKGNDDEKKARTAAIQAATRRAIEVPLQTMRLAADILPLAENMVRTGNPNSITDAGVGAICARSAVLGAYFNVKINLTSLHDKAYAAAASDESNAILVAALAKESEIIALVQQSF
jgi:glutamate formiminotransferase / formiminotetrahydrofolate cyclodeaminase